MKIFFSSLLFMFSFYNLLAQNDSTVIPYSIPRQLKAMSYDVIKCNPAALLLGPNVLSSEIGLNYEFSLSKTHSVSLGASLIRKNIFIYLSEKLDSSSSKNGNVVQNSSPLKIAGYRFQAQYKWILASRNYPSGLYIGPHVSYCTVNVSNQQRGFTKDYYRIVLTDISMLLGCQFLSRNTFFMDLYTGWGYKYNYVTYHKTVKDYKKVDNEFIFTGIPIKVKFSLGFYIGYKL